MAALRFSSTACRFRTPLVPPGDAQEGMRPRVRQRLAAKGATLGQGAMKFKKEKAVTMRMLRPQAASWLLVKGAELFPESQQNQRSSTYKSQTVPRPLFKGLVPFSSTGRLPASPCLLPAF